MHLQFDYNAPRSFGDLYDLFRTNGWDEQHYARDVFYALQKSSHIVSVWDVDCECKLVGLARSMDDGFWSANIDCVVVHGSYQHRGIGTLLMQELLKQLEGIKYLNLSPNDMSCAAFYEKFGFVRVTDGGLMQKLS